MNWFHDKISKLGNLKKVLTIELMHSVVAHTTTSGM